MTNSNHGRPMLNPPDELAADDRAALVATLSMLSAELPEEGAPVWLAVAEIADGSRVVDVAASVTSVLDRGGPHAVAGSVASLVAASASLNTAGHPAAGQWLGAAVGHVIGTAAVIDAELGKLALAAAVATEDKLRHDPGPDAPSADQNGD